MITRIEFNAHDLQRQGLETREFAGLGPIVVLAGPNGGGKSRHLDLVHATVEAFVTGSATHRVEYSGDNLPSVVRLRYVPFGTQKDPTGCTQGDIDASMYAVNNSSYPAIAEGLHVYLEVMARALWNYEHPQRELYPDVVMQYEQAQRFNDIVEGLLGVRVHPLPVDNARIVPSLFGQHYTSGTLSTGQQVLLCWAILLATRVERYQGAIVLLDEPEVYLHPDVCVRAIESLQRLIGPGGQIWIATHSLPLVAWCGAMSLYFVEGGNASFAGSASSRIWRSLLGGDDMRDAMISFLDEDAAAALIRFSSECLLQPDVSPSRASDPQPSQLSEVVANRLRSGQSVRILEIGAGKGRLVSAVADTLKKDEVLRSDNLEYIAYQDKRFMDEMHRGECERQLFALRALGANVRYSTDLADLRARDADRVDVVVLANTLHEIPIEDWMPLFGGLANIGASNATLLVIEDQEPSMGELPHAKGFLILERNEWRALLDSEIGERVRMWNGRRLTAFEIALGDLVKVTRDNIRRAIELVSARALDEILQIRSQDSYGHRAGRRHALYAMLHVNATLALRIL